MPREHAESQDSFTSDHEIPLIAEELERLLAAARPRLVSVARGQGIAPDLIEDVIQETMVEAWQHLAYLRDPARFHIWLNGICRNVCLRWWRRASRTDLRQESLSHFAQADETGNGQEDGGRDIIDPLAPDPAEELEHQDLATLLDHAMAYLPPTTRVALELCYLAELPPAEVAPRLGLSVNALEVRLHRARQQLRELLSSTLRDEAQTFDLALDRPMAEGWRKSRLWCFLCGRHRLYGYFHEQDNGSVTLLMNCPGCSSTIVDFNDLGSLGKLRSFRPAMKRGIQMVAHLCTQVMESNSPTCPICGSELKARAIEQLNFGPPYFQRYCLLIDCPRCGKYPLSSVMSASLVHPAAVQFMQQHPRWITEPEDLVEHAGSSVIRVRLADAVSVARLSLLIQPGTVQAMEAIKE